jgi:hypothetical protein
MSILGNIARAIFGRSAKAGTTAAAPTSSSDTSAAVTGKPMTKAEVEAMIAKLAEEHREKFDFRHSIVDLMKLLKLDSPAHTLHLRSYARSRGPSVCGSIGPSNRELSKHNLVGGKRNQGSARHGIDHKQIERVAP